ncbi:glutathione S-transferase [Sphingomonas vulcanisoli]|uniref:Glutathione S-transferase n=1 Tax=Sphingomonas vulcanisoli TaxID=1658060 RepID=A0ABX0TY09_9SPHN|nr:glutathione S-transferase family protein [Sphingomonas vulcanisoli]NIJ09614.1 glutathione S-transferase [Sphingomonas vulcanisoli]
MADTTLYFFPLSCARVAMTALEQVGIDYDVSVINLMAHGQKAPEYLAINPVGKVPALKVGDEVLTENVAIILYLDELYPEAKLLPPATGPIDRARARADLMWVATVLHPLVRQLRAPKHYTTGDTAPVSDNALEEFGHHFAELDAKFATRDWWYGAQWAAIDGYLAWILSGFTSVGNKLDAFPALAGYVQRLHAHPAYARMFAKEGELMEQQGLTLPPHVVR